MQDNKTKVTLILSKTSFESLVFFGYDHIPKTKEIKFFLVHVKILVIQVPSMENH